MSNTGTAPAISSSYVEGNPFNRESLPNGNLAAKRRGPNIISIRGFRADVLTTRVEARP